MEAWKATKRRFHLFETGDEDRTEVERQSRRKLGLRQGFFTMAKSRTSSVRSLSRRGTDRSHDDLEKGEKSIGGQTLRESPTTTASDEKRVNIEQGGDIQPKGRTPEQQV